jgi:galactokinase
LNFNCGLILYIFDLFKKKFKSDSILYVSPGRINLVGFYFVFFFISLGKHTDYNNGFVLPGAIDKAIYLGLQANGRSDICVYSLGLDKYI